LFWVARQKSPNGFELISLFARFGKPGSDPISSRHVETDTVFPTGVCFPTEGAPSVAFANEIVGRTRNPPSKTSKLAFTMPRTDFGARH
jgi:hypothetical protein